MATDDDFLENLKAIGSAEGVNTCLAIAAEAMGSLEFGEPGRGGELMKAIKAITERDEARERIDAELFGFCWELERFISGWVTGVNPLEDKRPSPFKNLPIGPTPE